MPIELKKNGLAIKQMITCDQFCQCLKVYVNHTYMETGDIDKEEINGRLKTSAGDEEKENTT